MHTPLADLRYLAPQTPRRSSRQVNTEPERWPLQKERRIRECNLTLLRYEMAVLGPENRQKLSAFGAGYRESSWRNSPNRNGPRALSVKIGPVARSGQPFGRFRVQDAGVYGCQFCQPFEPCEGTEEMPAESHSPNPQIISEILLDRKAEDLV